MKFLIVILVVGVAVWLWLRGRGREQPTVRPASGDSGPQAMVQCRHCGIHLPGADALTDSRGAFCTEAHRLAGPRAP